MAMIQMRQPHEVEHPWPKKSKITSKIFSPHPRMLNAKRPRMIMAMIPTISITISLVVHAVDSPLA